MGRGFGFLARGCLVLAALVAGCKSIPYLNFSFDLVLEAQTPNELDGVFVILLDTDRLNETDSWVELTMQDELSKHDYWEHLVVNEEGLFERLEIGFVEESVEVKLSEEGAAFELSIRHSLLESADLQAASLLILAEHGHEQEGWPLGARAMRDAEDTVQLSLRGLEFRKALTQ